MEEIAPLGKVLDFCHFQNIKPIYTRPRRFLQVRVLTATCACYAICNGVKSCKIIMVVVNNLFRQNFFNFNNSPWKVFWNNWHVQHKSSRYALSFAVRTLSSWLEYIVGPFSINLFRCTHSDSFNVCSIL